MSLVATFVALSLVAAAPDEPEAIFKSAIEDFEFGEHYQASEKLRSILEPLRLTSKEDLIVARQYLGACYHLLGDKMKSKLQFTMLLSLDSQHKLDPEVFSPALVEFFESVRAEVGILVLEEKKIDEKKIDPGLEKNAADTKIEKPLPGVRSPPPLALAFIPFGAGQFSNRQPVKGALFAVAEVGLLTTAAATFVMFNGLKVEDPSCPDAGLCVLPENKDKASTLQAVYLSTFWAGLGVVAIGVVEALISYPGDALEAQDVPNAGAPGWRKAGED